MYYRSIIHAIILMVSVVVVIVVGVLLLLCFNGFGRTVFLVDQKNITNLPLHKPSYTTFHHKYSHCLFTLIVNNFSRTSYSVLSGVCNVL